MPRFPKIIPFIALLLLILPGCDSIPFVDNSSDYKGASRGRPLEVPPDLTSVSTDDAFSVPGAATYSAYNQDRDKPGQPEKILPETDSVRYERAGSQRWLVVNAPPEKIWPVVRDFWTDLGFAVVVENPQTGVMETEWVDPSNLTKDDKGNYLDKFQGWLDKLNALNTRQKFRTRLERGSEDVTTDIYMSHRAISDAPNADKTKMYTPVGRVDSQETIYKENFEPDAKSRALAEDIDAELLRRLMVKLGVAEKQSRTIIANPIQEKRATLSKATDGLVTLELKDQFDRAWRRVGLALDRIGFMVEDRNRSQGLFYVRYSNVEEDTSNGKDKGWLDKLKFWGDDDQKDPSKPQQKKDDKSTQSSTPQYHIKLERKDEGTDVTVVDSNNKPDRSQTANRILSLLYDQLK